jgi:hypothetical protein
MNIAPKRTCAKVTSPKDTPANQNSQLTRTLISGKSENLKDRESFINLTT